jgi:2-oxoglutarate dehydrogenase E1 component
VLPDERGNVRADDVSRLVLCSGKVYYDLISGQEVSRAVAVVRVEQLGPFPAARLLEEIHRYPSLREVVWLQEEPHNMGAWSFVEPRLLPLLPEGVALEYVGRPEMASPAEGTLERHGSEQDRIAREAVGGLPAPETPVRGMRRAS